MPLATIQLRSCLPHPTFPIRLKVLVQLVEELVAVRLGLVGAAWIRTICSGQLVQAVDAGRHEGAKVLTRKQALDQSLVRRLGMSTAHGDRPAAKRLAIFSQSLAPGGRRRRPPSSAGIR